MEIHFPSPHSHQNPEKSVADSVIKSKYFLPLKCKTKSGFNPARLGQLQQAALNIYRVHSSSIN